MATAEQYIQYQTLRLAIGLFFGVMWIHYIFTCFGDIVSFEANLDRMQLKLLFIWFWNLFDIFARLYLMKTMAWDIMIHNILIVLILPFIVQFQLIVHIALFGLLFDELILIYFAFFRMYQFYKKSLIPLWLHWMGTFVTFIRLCITFYCIYYFHLKFPAKDGYYEVEFIIAMVLFVMMIGFDIAWIQLVIRRHLAYGFKAKALKSD